jgi:hypothetical protein
MSLGIDIVILVGMSTTRTSVSGVALCGTGGSCYLVGVAMTQSRNSFLLDKNSVTDRAVPSFRLTGSGAGGGYGFVDNFGMSLSRNGLLCNQNGVTEIAVLTLGLTGSGTGGGYGIVDDLGMSLSIDIVIFVAVGTTRASIGGVTLCSTGGSSDLGGIAVSQCCNSFLLDENGVTGRAMLTLGLT